MLKDTELQEKMKQKHKPKLDDKGIMNGTEQAGQVKLLTRGKKDWTEKLKAGKKSSSLYRMLVSTTTQTLI